jgi:phage gp29-like protein
MAYTLAEEIAQAARRPGKTPALREQQTDAETTGARAMVGHLRRELAEHPSEGLTPARLYAILRDAEAGDLRAQHELGADMEEKDPQIQSDLGKRRQACAELDWDIVPPPDATPAEQMAADQAKEVLGGLEPAGDQADSGMEDLIIQLGDGLLHGWVNLALPWDTDGAARIVRQPQWVPHGWFRLHPDHQDRLMLRDASHTGEPLWPLGWVQHRHRAKSGYVARMGLLRVLCWPYLFQNYALGDLAELLEILGIPVRLGKYPSQTATKEERNTLLRAITQMGHSAAGIIPDSMTVELLEAASGSEKPFETMLHWCERSKSKAILGGTLTTGTDQGAGAYALGQVHERGLDSLISSDARQYAATIRVAMLWPMAALNYGVTELRRAPRLVIDTGSAADLAALADSLPKLVSVGMQIPTRWAHEEARIPLPEQGEDVLATAAPSQSAPPAAAPLASQGHTCCDPLATDTAGNHPAPPDGWAERLTEDMQPGVDALLAQIRPMLRQAQSLPELAAMLRAAYPRLDRTRLQDALRPALTAAQLAGGDSADEEGASDA